jgi:drug/metabolite transporter (DMT)-like permease
VRTTRKANIEGKMSLKHSKNWVLFLFVVFVWSSGWSVMKVALTYIGPLNFALQRFVLSAIVLSPLLVHMRKKIRIEKGALPRLLVLAAVNTSSIIPLYWGLVYEASGIGAILTYTQPLFVFCLCVLFLRLEAKPVRLLGALVGFSGVIVLSVERAGSVQASANIGDVLLLLGAFLWAVAIVYYKKSLSDVDPVLASVIQQALGAVIIIPLALGLEGFSFPLAPSYLTMVLYLGIFNSGIAVFLWLLMIREEDVTVLALSCFLIPMFAVFIGWLFLAENFQPISFVGMGMILVGLYLTNKSGSSS